MSDESCDACGAARTVPVETAYRRYHGELVVLAGFSAGRGRRRR